MYIVYSNDAIYGEYSSPVTAELIAEAQRRLGYDTDVVFDEGARCCVE